MSLVKKSNTGDMFQLNNMTSSKKREGNNKEGNNNLTWHFKGLENEISLSDLSILCNMEMMTFCLASHRPLYKEVFTQVTFQFLCDIIYVT